MPYCVARSVGFASAFAGSIAQKLNSALELELEAWGGKEDAKMLIFVKMLIAALHIPLNTTPAHGWRRRREASQSKERAGHCRLRAGRGIFCILASAEGPPERASVPPDTLHVPWGVVCSFGFSAGWGLCREGK